MLLAGVEFHDLPRVLVCFLVEFDLLFAFGVLSCRILGSSSFFILYVHEHGRLGFGMLTGETAELIAFVENFSVTGPILSGIGERVDL